MSENHPKDGNGGSRHADAGLERVTDENANDFSHIYDEVSLRLMLAREAIELAKVPGRAPDRLSNGYSEGERCAVCGLSLTKAEFGCKLEFIQNGRNFVGYHFHYQCLVAWEYAWGKDENAGSGSNGQDARTSEKTSQNGRDPGHGGGA